MEAPLRFAAVLEAFLEETGPARFDREGWLARLGPFGPYPDGRRRR